MVPFILPYDLDLTRAWPLENYISGYISVIIGQNVANFFRKVARGRAFQEIQKYF